MILIYKPWFEASQFVGRRTVLSTILAWFSRKSAHIRTRTSSSSQRMCGNQVSYLTSQCQWNVRILTVILCGAGKKDFPGQDTLNISMVHFVYRVFFFGVQCGRNSNKLDKLYKSPLTLWTSAISCFTKHASGKCEMHNFAMIAMENFLRNMTRESVPIDQQINNLLQQQIKRNREILKSLFKTIIFCGKNNIALRGPRDDDPQNASLSGNFQALLEFRIDSGDHTLQHHLETAPRNATYISKTIQNEMITTVGPIIVNNLSQEIRDSKYFSIMSDEAADISNKENLPVLIRFLDSTKTVREEFVRMEQQEQLSKI